MKDDSGRELLLGNLAIELGLISAEQLNSALEDQGQDQARFGFVRQMGSILIARGWISHPQLMDLLREQSMRRARRLSGSAGPSEGDRHG
jgi:hypothetical protein